MHQITKHHLVAQMLSNTARQGQPTSIPVSPPPLLGDNETAIPLPPPLNLPSRPIVDVLTKRRSGGIVDSEITEKQLSTLLSAWHLELPESLLPDPALMPIAFPVALAVSGLQSAAYRYDHLVKRLLLIVPVEREMVRNNILLQWEHGNGALLLFFVTPMSRWLQQFGDRGYRALALQIGWITDRLYLLAEALSLSYTASGGFAPANADALFGLDGYHYTTFFSFIVGGART